MSNTIVLDIDETLVHTFREFNNNHIKLYNEIMTNPKYLILRPRLYTFILDGSTFYGIKRPHLDEFIDFCFKHYDVVAIWSAGQEHYVRKMVDIIFIDKHPTIVYSADNLPSNSTTKIYNKPLKKLADENKLPYDNMIIIDDRKENFEPNPEKGFLISAYEPVFTIESLMYDDKTLLNIISNNNN